MDWLNSFIDQYSNFAYLIVFLAIIIEGDVSLLLFGALSKEHYVKFWEVYVIAIVAAAIHDIIFWNIGDRIAKSNRTKYLFFDFIKAKAFLERMRPLAGIFIFLSKFAWNLNRVVLVCVGYIRIDFKTFVKYSIPVAILWPLIFLSVGYVFADQTQIFKQKIEIAGLFIIGILVLLVVFELKLKTIFKKYFYEDSGVEKNGGSDVK
ncbi:MAG: hypothetical protein WC705_02475 [Candidatus Paceibacterota bacterium]|jgi:membrane protein DedA with SNARE-associated domain